jgi:hypothetical protein
MGQIKHAAKVAPQAGERNGARRMKAKASDEPSKRDAEFAPFQREISCYMRPRPA